MDARPARAQDGLSYGRYLKVGELLELQQPVSAPAVHDEHLFVVIHQVCELWFKQILVELESVRDALLEGRLREALRGLDRVARIERILVAQIDVLDSMPFQRFHEFRGLLRPASGFQSVQFREIEALSGLKQERHLRIAESDVERARLRRRLGEPSVWDAFRAAMGTAGLPMPAADEGVRHHSLSALMSADCEQSPLAQIAEGLIEHDQLLALWRTRHVLLVERQIGAAAGTGGSSGGSHLRGTLEQRLYPELWSVRTDFPPPAGGAAT
jgi:tryptophan 2,3-dioxygenase